MLWFFIFSESLSQSGSNDMGHIRFQANYFFTTWLTTRLYFWSILVNDDYSTDHKVVKCGLSNFQSQDRSNDLIRIYF